jgi:hypothetical protein
VRIFKDKGFGRFADKEGINDDILRKVAADLEKGVWDANLGGGVYKHRIARSGEGKRGGYRAIIFFQSENKMFFVYGYPKSTRDNIKNNELRYFKEEAKDKLNMSDKQIEALLDNGALQEIV